MKELGYAVLFVAVGLYLFAEGAFYIAWGALGGFVVGVALMALRDRLADPAAPSAPVEHVSGQVERLDPAAARLMAMGFPPDLIAAPLAKARAAGASDPVAYVMGVLIR